jgi:uncharacterized protein
MPIQIGGKVNVNAPRDLVWEKIFDVEILKNVIGHVPGIVLQQMEQVDDVTYVMSAVVGVAAVRGKYDAKITVLERTAPSYVKFRGEGKGGGNVTTGEVALNLNAVEQITEMEYSGDGNLTGPLANFGQRLVDTVGKQFIDQGAILLAHEIEHSVAPAAEAHAHVEAPAPYGRMFQAFVLFIVMVAIIVTFIVLAVQSWTP